MWTEDEATELWCPMARQSGDRDATYNRMNNGGIPPSCHCLASRCMMWRWATKPRDGYCGLAGPPKSYFQINKDGELVPIQGA